MAGFTMFARRLIRAGSMAVAGAATLWLVHGAGDAAYAFGSFVSPR